MVNIVFDTKPLTLSQSIIHFQNSQSLVKLCCCFTQPPPLSSHHHDRSREVATNIAPNHKEYQIRDEKPNSIYHPLVVYNLLIQLYKSRMLHSTNHATSSFWHANDISRGCQDWDCTRGMPRWDEQVHLPTHNSLRDESSLIDPIVHCSLLCIL